MTNDILDKVKKIIVKKTGLDAKEIHLESYFEDDLNIGELELSEILEDLEELYALDDLIENKDEFETVSDLLSFLEERVDQ